MLISLFGQGIKDDTGSEKRREGEREAGFESQSQKSSLRAKRAKRALLSLV